MATNDTAFILEQFVMSGPSRERVISKDDYIIVMTKVCDILFNGSNREPGEIESWIKEDFEKDSQDKPKEVSSVDDKISR